MVISKKQGSLSQAQLKELLLYNYETGEFVWIVKKVGVKVGKVAGCLDKTHGYIKIMLNGVGYQAHRLVWLYVHGYFPNGENYQIDHIDGDRTNNRISNLREVSQCVNMRNRKMLSNNTSGVTGVQLYSRTIKNKLYQYWVTTWRNASNEACRMTFSVQKLGYTNAYKMAISCRTEQIRLLENEHNIIYSERHGIK